MATYKELTAQIQALSAKAEEARVQELGEAIQKIIELMTEYDISLSEINKALPAKLKAAAKTSSSPKPGKTKGVAFRDSVTGREWNGHGRPPAWVLEADRTAGGREQYRVSQD